MRAQRWLLVAVIVAALSGQTVLDLLRFQVEAERSRAAERKRYEEFIRPREEWMRWQGCIAAVDQALHKYYAARGAFVIPEREREQFWRAVDKFETCDEHRGDKHGRGSSTTH